MAFVHFLSVAVCLGAWLLLGLLEERVESPFLRFWLRGLRGGTLAMVFCLLLAVGLAHGPLVVVADDQRTLVFFGLALGLGMIGVPIGFLAAMARSRTAEE